MKCNLWGGGRRFLHVLRVDRCFRSERFLNQKHHGRAEHSPIRQHVFMVDGTQGPLLLALSMCFPLQLHLRGFKFPWWEGDTLISTPDPPLPNAAGQAFSAGPECASSCRSSGDPDCKVAFRVSLGMCVLKTWKPEAPTTHTHPPPLHGPWPILPQRGKGQGRDNRQGPPAQLLAGWGEILKA